MSAALEEWRGASSRALDEIELLHRQIEAVAVGGAALTQQISYTYATLIVAHFQGYCRGLHTEATRVLVANSDFGRFGLKFWPAVEGDDRRNRSRKKELEELCAWRNGIVHGDISRKRSGGRLVPPDLTLETCRDWRRSLGNLVVSIDRVIAVQCQDLVRARPW